jgi:hypothetical protein
MGVTPFREGRHKGFRIGQIQILDRPQARKNTLEIGIEAIEMGWVCTETGFFCDA